MSHCRYSKRVGELWMQSCAMQVWWDLGFEHGLSLMSLVREPRHRCSYICVRLQFRLLEVNLKGRAGLSHILLDAEL